MVTNQSIRRTKEDVISSSPVKLVDEVITRAFLDRASDIHVEPMAVDCQIRMRVDGVLINHGRYNKLIHEEVVARLKILSGLRTDIRLSPQDGRFRVQVSSTSLHVRVSVIPSIHGEKCVLRLLPSSLQNHSLEGLGFNSLEIDKISKLAEISHGMVLVVGPTGSGKTTTLYELLQRKSALDISVVTLEDPVEYSIPGVTQIPINTTMSFANALRAVVRQDPDVIMVGEIRDHITAELAIHAALTGHLLFSTLHTNDAVTALPRLIDMGIEPFLIASTVRMVISQRLVRKICVMCKSEVKMTQGEFEYLVRVGDIPETQKLRIFKGAGCSDCKNTGYCGRTVISEVLVVDEKIRSFIMQKNPASDLQKVALQQGMRPLIKDAVSKVLTGITTCEEVAAVCNI